MFVEVFTVIHQNADFSINGMGKYVLTIADYARLRCVNKELRNTVTSYGPFTICKLDYRVCSVVRYFGIDSLRFTTSEDITERFLQVFGYVYDTKYISPLMALSRNTTSKLNLIKLYIKYGADPYKKEGDKSFIDYIEISDYRVIGYILIRYSNTPVEFKLLNQLIRGWFVKTG